MTDREKLIQLLASKPELLKNLNANIVKLHKLADHLLANGVTFAKDTDVPSKWISVEDGLPEESGTYITAALDGHTTRVTFVKWQKRNRHWELAGARSYWKITHWMPLPKPPKRLE